MEIILLQVSAQAENHLGIVTNGFNYGSQALALQIHTYDWNMHAMNIYFSRIQVVIDCETKSGTW